MEVFGEIVTEVVRELLHEIRDSGDVEPPDERWPEIVRQHPEQCGEIGRVGSAHHLVEGGLVTGLDEVFDPRRGFAQTIGGEIDGEGLPGRLVRTFELFLVDERIGHFTPDA